MFDRKFSIPYQRDRIYSDAPRSFLEKKCKILLMGGVNT